MHWPTRSLGCIILSFMGACVGIMLQNGEKKYGISARSGLLFLSIGPGLSIGTFMAIAALIENDQWSKEEKLFMVALVMSQLLGLWGVYLFW